MEHRKKRKFPWSSILFIIGFLILMYPTFSNVWNEYRALQVMTEYEDTVGSIEEPEMEEILEEAREYNRQHTQNIIIDAFTNQEEYILSHPYDQLLNPSGNEIMGFIHIPKIDVSLPIYHGVGAEVLEKGVGHVEGTSLPVGGESTHSVIAGHRGLPTAKLFTDLDQIEIGDTFYLSVLNSNLYYEVDQIEVVLPSETDLLKIEEGQDLVTLLTCTPYGVNTHRMLVRGHRVYDVEQEVTEKEADSIVEKMTAKRSFRIMLAGLFVFFIVLVLLNRFEKRRRNK